MSYVADFPPRSGEEHERFLNIIHGALRVRRHYELFTWLSQDLQFFLPHDILLAAWGDFMEGYVFVDVISPLPGMRTGPVVKAGIEPFVQCLFKRWQENGRAPFLVQGLEGFPLSADGKGSAVSRCFRSMHSAIVHGIKDERGQQDCLYIIFAASGTIPAPASRYMEVLLPYIDTALRKVIHLPEQLSAERIADEGEPLDKLGLSDREAEILEWVCAGKSNQEIGMILEISAFTVKNHLQRIFRKLDVTNRAQAVSKFAARKPPFES